MPHRPKPATFVRNILLRDGFRDKALDETANRVSPLVIRDLLKAEYENLSDIFLKSLTQHVLGEVLEDSRGRGTLQ